ncbi:hypothetical protein M4D49_29040 [Cupriavidus pauculus]|uniref:hypothetical protein n=1 Tax=Cupriavidus TaxID=106589 RepID=UPI0004934090|nr:MULTISPECIES: hypothetical protein [Cupriavidus]MCM3609524.1 hypothetical protein [Cupriavidus pauculus]
MQTDPTKEQWAAPPTMARPEYVARQIMRGAVVVAAHHPVLGAVYWSFTDESDVNAPDHYGLTTQLDSAHRFRPGHVPYANFQTAIRECNTREVIYDNASGQYEGDVGCGDFSLVASDIGLDANTVLAWFERAVWVECPAPHLVRYIGDFNGYVGYRPVWTEQLSEALRFSQGEIEAKDDLDVSLACASGEMVAVAEAAHGGTLAEQPPRSPINHALEADVAWTHVRLGLGGYIEMERWSRIAFAHAARAGREAVIVGEFEGESGEIAPVSGHLLAYSELLEAFRVGAAVQQASVGTPTDR